MTLPTITRKIEEDIAAFLVTAGYGTAGVDIFACRELPPDPAGGVPVACIFIQTFGGPESKGMFGARHDVRLINVQVLSRGARGEAGETAGLNTARQLRASLHRATVSGYMALVAQQSEPTPLGVGDTEVYRHVNNFTAWIDETLT